MPPPQPRPPTARAPTSRAPTSRASAPRGPAEPLGTAARRAALRLLDAVLRRGEALEGALASATRALPGGPDRSLAHALAAATLRRLADLDAAIDGATRQQLPPDSKARAALRLALAQVMILGTPPHAAIATVLPLVAGGPRRLVHGVFGALARAGATLPAQPALPPAVAARWRAAWGEAVTAAIARGLAEPPPLDLTLADAAATGEWAERLGAASLLPGQLRLARGHAAVAELPGYADGAWWVQDLAAALPARLLLALAGPGSVVDACAAPGGKAMQLAAAGRPVVALDASESRLARLRANLARTRLAAEVVPADALSWAPAEPVAAVLLDAPCSATGIARRHPDVLHRAHAGLIAEQAAQQARLLARAATWVRPGGVLVYATCSLEQAEGEEQLAAFLASRPGWRVAAPPAGVLPAGVAAGADGSVRTHPGLLADQGGLDGFFVAALVAPA